MTKISSIEQFELHLETGKLDEAEALLAKMVEEIPDSERVAPFSAPVRLKSKHEQEAVEIFAAETKGRIAIPLLNRLSRSLRNHRFRIKTSGQFNGDIFVSEGDSWFQYPVFLDDIIDELSRDSDKAVYSLGAAGDLLEDMANDKEYISAIGETGAKYLLLSGGGNDLLGGGALEEYLLEFHEDATATDLIDEAALSQKLEQLKGWYQTIINDVARYYPEVQIYAHAYDTPIPEENGKWLGTPLQNRNIPLNIGRQIIEIILTQFSKSLGGLSAGYSNFNFVDLNDVVGDSQQSWYDELHPKNSGFSRVAEKFRENLMRISNVSSSAALESGPRDISAASYSQINTSLEIKSVDSQSNIAISSFSQREKMAREIIDYEARRDSGGRLLVYRLHPDDGGGAYEVAGINEKYHKEEADKLVQLIEAGRYSEAEEYAVEFIASYTDRADRWCTNTAIEFYLRDTMYNRGPGGAAWIVQHATGVATDMVVGQKTRNAIAIFEKNPKSFLKKLRESRESYERLRRDETSRFWRGLVNRWNKAYLFAESLLEESVADASNRNGTKHSSVESIGAGERILNCVKSLNDDDDWGYAAARDADVVQDVLLPDELDLRRDWWNIGNQGRTGSCVGWATADSVLRWHFVNSGRLSESERLSIRFSWVAAKETDEFRRRPTTFIEEAGTSLKAALDVARKLGAVPEDTLPFDRQQVFIGPVSSFYARAAQFRIGSYINLRNDLKAWRSWLYQNGPILTRLDVDSNFNNAGATQGILDRYDRQTAGGGHAVALVGYSREGFIVRNSWSENWGDGGYAYASNAYAREAFTEAYGITI